ncbi:heavy-metal-associated domain-containing protein [Microbispora sp. H10836]|uniref:heavy-metal-associated domain-containing protein n=1 Tax=Microbispora sp. H10836 TaxID=2729106 RepID=UPI001475EC4A|nr:cation transporter [Microbispora sp. H10836]
MTTATGMTCGHRVSSVKEEVGEVPGVTGVEVDPATGLVTVESDMNRLLTATHVPFPA